MNRNQSADAHANEPTTAHLTRLMLAGLLVSCLLLTACGGATKTTTVVEVVPGLGTAARTPNYAAAKEQVRTGETAAETYSTDHNGNYTGMTMAKLQETEPTLSDTTTATFSVVGTPSASSYEVQSVSQGTEDTFTIKNSEGTITRTCTAKSAITRAGCPTGTW